MLYIVFLSLLLILIWYYCRVVIWRFGIVWVRYWHSNGDRGCPIWYRDVGTIEFVRLLVWTMCTCGYDFVPHKSQLGTSLAVCTLVMLKVDSVELVYTSVKDWILSAFLNFYLILIDYLSCTCLSFMHCDGRLLILTAY